MNASSTGLARLGKAKALALMALVAAFGMLALAGTSKAAPTDHNLTVDHGKLTLGVVFADKDILPAPVAEAGCPSIPPYTGTDMDKCGPSPLSVLVPNYPDGNAHIKVSEENGTATVAPADFKTPMTYVPNPTNPAQMVPISVSVPSGLTGTWDSATGALDLSGALRISVVTGAKGSSPLDPQLETCQIDVANAKWSTGLNAITPGIPFTDASGLDGTGAVSVAWDDLPNGTEINDGDCSTVNTVIHSAGAIWFGVGKSTPPAPPVCEAPLEGMWPNCVEPDKPKVAMITRVKVSNAKVKAGKKARVTIKVTNKGDAAFNGRVTLKSSKKTVKVAKSVKIKVAAGKTAAVKVVVKATKKAKGKVTITAKAGGKTGKGKVTVKKAKKKKRK